MKRRLLIAVCAIIGILAATACGKMEEDDWGPQGEMGNAMWVSYDSETHISNYTLKFSGVNNVRLREYITHNVDIDHHCTYQRANDSTIVIIESDSTLAILTEKSNGAMVATNWKDKDVQFTKWLN